MYFLKKCLFISERDQETKYVWGRGREDKETQNPKEAPGSEPSAHVGLKPTSCEIMNLAEVGCLTDWATQAPENPNVLLKNV